MASSSDAYTPLLVVGHLIPEMLVILFLQKLAWPTTVDLLFLVPPGSPFVQVPEGPN